MGIQKRRKRYLTAAILAAPATILFMVFLVYPIADTVISSFFDWNGIAGSAREFVGFQNLIATIQDEKFLKALKNAGIFMLGSFVIELPISLILTLIITEARKGGRLYRFCFFLPNILPITAVGLMWMFLLYPDGGAVNSVLSFLSRTDINVNWLGQMDTAIWAVMVVNMWIYSGYNMLIFAAAMSNIDRALYEAAELDGASYARRFFSITLPLMKPTMIVFAILAVTGSLRSFDIVYVMTGGGPNEASNLPSTLLYNEAFSYNDFGAANSIGTIILVLGLVFSVLMLRVSRADSAESPKKGGRS